MKVGRIFFSKWIVDARYDLFYFIFPFVFSIGIYWVHIFLGYRLNIEIEKEYGLFTFCIFSGLFDLPHIFQTFSRTHIDKIEYERHKWRIQGGLVFLLGLGCLSVVFHFEKIILMLGALFGVWHILRQNIGFVKIYKSIHKESHRIDHWLDLGVYYSLVCSGMINVHFDMICSTFGKVALFHQQYVWGVVFVFIAFLIFFIQRQIWLIMNHQLLNLQKLMIMGNTIILYSVLFFYLEVPLPVFVAIETIYHDIQYQGWIRFYQKEMFYQEESFVKQWFWKTTVVGVICSGFALGVQYTNIFPEKLAVFSVVKHPIVSFLYMSIFMVIVYHYYIDGIIWRMKESPELRAILKK